MCAEKKLAEYRAKQRKNEYLTQVNEGIRSLLRFRSTTKAMEVPETSQKLVIDSSDNEESPSEDLNYCKISFIQLVTYVLYFILWATLLALFVKLEFGLVYCVVSALIAICLNTRKGPKKRHEISAYSVFNKNCESIDGTLKAEQFEREIRFGAGSVR